MFKGILDSVVVVPVLLGMLAATSRRGRRGLLLLFALFLTYDVLYLVLLRYLRARWVG
jgi:hypothetical protein